MTLNSMKKLQKPILILAMIASLIMFVLEAANGREWKEYFIIFWLLSIKIDLIKT